MLMLNRSFVNRAVVQIEGSRGSIVLSVSYTNQNESIYWVRWRSRYKRFWRDPGLSHFAGGIRDLWFVIRNFGISAFRHFGISEFRDRDRGFDRRDSDIRFPQVRKGIKYEKCEKLHKPVITSMVSLFNLTLRDIVRVTLHYVNCSYKIMKDLRQKVSSRARKLWKINCGNIFQRVLYRKLHVNWVHCR